MGSQEIQNWSEPLLIKIFGLTRKVREGSERLDRWLSATTNLTNFEEESLQRLLRSAIQNLDGWNEEELKMKFIGPLFTLAGFHFEEEDGIQSYYERSISALVESHKLSVRPDFMVAKGILGLPEVPYFHFQEFKREQAAVDPMTQLLLAFLIAQELSKDDKPFYGAKVVGRLWYFVIMEGKRYHISKAYDATEEEDLVSIIAILRAFKRILKTELL
ncbi:MAG: hypothetical protein AAF740_09805 [Bacteroidota bacterium]